MNAIVVIIVAGLLTAGAAGTAFAVIALWGVGKRHDTPDPPRVQFRTRMWGGNVTMGE